jgi:hypothetical protein
MINKEANLQKIMEYVEGKKYKDPYKRVFSFSFGVMELGGETYDPKDSAVYIIILNPGIIDEYECEIENSKFRLNAEFIKEMEIKGIRFSDGFKKKYLS